MCAVELHSAFSPLPTIISLTHWKTASAWHVLYAFLSKPNCHSGKNFSMSSAQGEYFSCHICDRAGEYIVDTIIYNFPALLEAVDGKIVSKSYQVTVRGPEFWSKEMAHPNLGCLPAG